MEIKKITLVLFFLLFVGSVITIIDFSNASTNDVAEENLELIINTNTIQDNEGPKFWNLTGNPIYINDWSCKYSWRKTCRENDWCSGSGTLEDPYIIENVIIDGQNSGSCITIRNSRAYFIIRNCTLYNSGGRTFFNWGAGIKLVNCKNGWLFNNTCNANNGDGILEICGYNNNFSKNTISYNFYHGIRSWWSDNNNFLENEIKFNEINGIYFSFSDFHKIFRNTIDYNLYGISFIVSNNNSVMRNFIVGNNVSIYQFMSRGNIFIDNKFEYELPPPIPPEILVVEKDEDDEDDEKAQPDETQDQLLISLAIIGTSVGMISGVAIGYLFHKKKVIKNLTTPLIKPFKDKLKTATIKPPEEPIKLTPEIGLLPKNAIVKFEDLKKSAKDNNLKSKESGVNKKIHNSS